MKTARSILVASAIALGSLVAHAQQVPMYTHYMNNTLVINPAYAGSRDALTVTLLQRMQWIGFDGAPLTNTLTMHMPLRNEHIGLGLSVMNDQIGPSNNLSLNVDYAFMMKLTETSKLALGLSAGANIIQTDLNSLELDNPNDPAFQEDSKNRVTPDVGFGIYYSKERFYAGLSVPNLFQNSYSVVDQNDQSTLIGKEMRHYFLIAGGLLRMSNEVDFKPTTLIKVTQGAPIQADLTASFVILKRFMLGAMFRTGDAVGGLVGFDITDQLHVGYSYDWSYGLRTSSYNNGSHEIVLRYDVVCFNKKQIRSPRNF